MTTLMLNGRDHQVPPGTTLVDLVAQTTGRALGADGAPRDGGRLGVAVAVDSMVVPRSRWHATEVGEGHTVEIITAMQGG